MKKRIPAMDVVRCFALFCLVSLCFFKRVGLYDIPVKGFSMLILISIREFFKICLPLFMLLTGYLQKEKQPTRKHYEKFFYFAGIYILASAFCIAISYVLKDGPFSPATKVLDIFQFRIHTYGWYMEMYFGLFLLIPFLNMIYKGAETQRTRKILLLTLLLMTALASVVNIWRFGDLSWFLQPSSASEYNFLAPDFWLFLSPITYYFIGAYLRDYPLKLKPGKHLLLILAFFLIKGCFSYYRSYGGMYFEGEWAGNRSILTTIQSTLVFSFLQNRSWKSIGPKTRKILSGLSFLSLGAALSAVAFEDLFYPVLLSKVPTVTARVLYFPLAVSLVLVCSLATSAVLNGIYKVLASLCTRLLCRKKTPSEGTA